MGTVCISGCRAQWSDALPPCPGTSAGVRQSAFAGSASHQISLPSRCGGIYATGCHRDVEELLAEPGVQVDHVTMFRWA